MLNIKERKTNRNRRYAIPYYYPTTHHGETSSYYYTPVIGTQPPTYYYVPKEASQHDVLVPRVETGMPQGQTEVYPSSGCCSCGIGDAGPVGLPGPPGDPGFD